MIWMTLLACSPIRSAKDAPFTLRSLESALWSEYSPDESSATAILVLADASVACDALEGRSYTDLVEEVTKSGSGLVFQLEQWAFGGPATLPSWEGLYSEETGTMQNADGSTVYRSFTTSAFDGGFIFDVESYQEPSWLDLRAAGEVGASGSFDNRWWSGSFEASPCEPWGADGGGSGYYTGWYY